MLDLSQNAADWLFGASNVLLVLGAGAVLCGTIGVIWTGGIRELYSNERISKNEAETASATADAARANEGAEQARATAESLHLEIAKANERAAEAQLALEKYKAPRSLTSEQLKAIAAVAAAHRGIAIDLFLAGDALDMPALAQSLSNVLIKAGGWAPMTWTWIGVTPFTGSFILIKEHAKDDNVAAAKALSMALNGTQLASPLQIWPDPWGNFGGMLNGAVYSADRSEIRLIIGAKPN